MESWLTELGVGGILAIIILREVFNFLKSNKNNKNDKTNCSGDISREEFESHKKVVQYESTCIQIVKRLEGRFDSVDTQLGEVKTMVGDLKP